MKKIRSAHRDNDRIICLNDHDTLRLYYRPGRSGKSYWLCDTDFSLALHLFFRDHGSRDSEGYSIRLAQLYDFRNYYNPRLTYLVERIPRMVEYVIRDEIA